MDCHRHQPATSQLQLVVWDPVMDSLLEQRCDDGRNPQWCDALVDALQKDGSPQALAHARMIRAKECAQGDKKSCE